MGARCRRSAIINFSDALRKEIKVSKGITLTALRPDSVGTEFFECADMRDTLVGAGNNGVARAARIDH